MQFLEQDQSNTRVYISYAMALNKLEGYKSAKKVFDLAFAKACCSEEEGRKKGEKKEGFNDLSLLLYVHAAKLELKQGHCDNALWILALMAHKRSFEPCNMDKLALLTFANSAREKAKAALLLTNTSTIKPVNFKCAPILPQSDFLALTFGLYWLDYLIDGLESW